MKRIILLLLTIVSLVNVFGQSKQDGFVKGYNERRKNHGVLPSVC